MILENLPFRLGFLSISYHALLTACLHGFSGYKIYRYCSVWVTTMANTMYFVKININVMVHVLPNMYYAIKHELILEGRGLSSMECGMYFITNVFHYVMYEVS